LISLLCVSIYCYQEWQVSSSSDERKNAIKMNAPFQGGSTGLPTVAMVLVVFVFIGFFILMGIGLYYGIKVQSQRYSLASDAMKKGNTKILFVCYKVNNYPISGFGKF
jgi:hypothetical protein